MPKVSVITPCYNAETFIEEAIASVRRQTLTDWEHIVVDDGSTDRSAEIVAALAEEDDRLRLVRQENGGTAKARNTGAAESTDASGYLLFLDADDTLKPRMLEVLTEYLDAHPAVGMAFCEYKEVDVEGRSLSDREHLRVRYAPGRFDVRQLRSDEPETPPLTVLVTSTSVPLPSQSLIRRTAFEETPGFDEVLGQGCEDTDFFLHITLRWPVHYVPQTLLCYRQHPEQWSKQGQVKDPPQRRFARKWRNIDGLSRTQKKRLRHAWRYWRTRIIPRIWWKAGKGALESGRYGKGLLLCTAATARFIVSPLTVGWGWRGASASETTSQFRSANHVPEST